MFNIRDFFYFEQMLTPKVITILYWLMLLYVTAYGMSVMFAGDKMTLAKFASGLGIIVGGAIMMRIASEVLLAVFRINENIASMANRE